MTLTIKELYAFYAPSMTERTWELLVYPWPDGSTMGHAVSAMLEQHQKIETCKISVRHMVGSTYMPAVKEIVEWLQMGRDQVSPLKAWETVSRLISADYLRPTCHGGMEVLNLEDRAEESRKTLARFMELYYPPLHPRANILKCL